MKIIVSKDNVQASKEAFLELKKSFKEKGSVLGLATGSTPILLYKNIIEFYHNEKYSFKNYKTVNLDEYVGIDINHPESYYSFMHRNLFDHIDIPESNINIPKGYGEDLLKNCEEYNNLLNSLEVDVQILGIGANGHIGFNEPLTPFDSTVHLVDLKEKTIKDNARFFDNDISKVPTKAITMGISNIMNAKKIILLAFGDNKKDAVYKMIKGEVSEDLPASILQNHPNVYVFLDEESAKLL